MDLGTNTSKKDLKGTRKDPSRHQGASEGPDSAVPLTGQRADFLAQEQKKMHASDSPVVQHRTVWCLQGAEPRAEEPVQNFMHRTVRWFTTGQSGGSPPDDIGREGRGEVRCKTYRRTIRWLTTGQSGGATGRYRPRTIQVEDPAIQRTGQSGGSPSDSPVVPPDSPVAPTVILSDTVRWVRRKVENASNG